MLLVVLAVIVLVAVGVYFWHRETEAAPQYSTVPASRGTVAQAVISSGTVNPVTTIQVGTYVSGVIQTILCDFNTEVKAGQLCAKIDPRPYQTVVDQDAAELATARAQLEKDRANLDYAKLIDERNAGLLQRGIVSQETADTSRNVYKQATAQLALDQATVAQREAQWKAARINLGYTDIVSPVNGTVVSRNVTQGQTVAASFQTPTLFLIATDLTKMQVDTNVSESDIGRVGVGNDAVFTVSSYPDRQFSGRVQQIRQAPQTVQNVVTYDVVVSVANTDLALKPGMTASIRIVTKRVDNVLRVPDQSLRYRPTARQTARPVPQQSRTSGTAANSAPSAERSQHVWILADGRPRRVPVTVGLDDDAYAEITGGDLHEGDAVIVSESAAASATPRNQTAPAGMTPLRR
ncbi:MAG TPA: efflux RND transporter periplasmic adaptor subunit [Noviherbaspirillum sp.]|jgi:HlyD family secretion protein